MEIVASMYGTFSVIMECRHVLSLIKNADVSLTRGRMAYVHVKDVHTVSWLLLYNKNVSWDMTTASIRGQYRVNTALFPVICNNIW